MFSTELLNYIIAFATQGGHYILFDGFTGDSLLIHQFTYSLFIGLCSVTPNMTCYSHSSPCIMCVQYREGTQYRGVLSTVGVFNTVGDIMSTVGDILSTMGGVQYRGDIMINVGGYHEYRGVFSTMGDIMSTVGGSLEYRGRCSVPWGIS